MNKAECIRASRIVCAAYGFASFEAMRELVIMKGYEGSGLSSVIHWRQVEKAFHTAQFLQWAAAGNAEERAYWIKAAAKRLPPMNLDRWRAMPQELRSLAA